MKGFLILNKKYKDTCMRKTSHKEIQAPKVLKIHISKMGIHFWEQGCPNLLC